MGPHGAEGGHPRRSFYGLMRRRFISRMVCPLSVPKHSHQVRASLLLLRGASMRGCAKREEIRPTACYLSGTAGSFFSCWVVGSTVSPADSSAVTPRMG